MFVLLLLLVPVAAVLFATLLKKLNDDYFILALTKRIKTLDGTPLENTAPVVKGRTIFGNSFDLIGLDSVGVFARARRLAKTMKRSYIEYVFGIPSYNIIDADNAELVFTHPNLLNKSRGYVFLRKFLKTGLLTATDKKWHMRRKLITPAFHFNILAKFLETFKSESVKFLQNLQSEGEEFVISLNSLIPCFTLNSICETALGVKLDDCLNGNAYRKSVNMMEEYHQKRLSNPLFINDFLFECIHGSTYNPHLKVFHEFSSHLIAKRRKLFEEEMKARSTEGMTADDIDFVCKKKSFALLDTLLLEEKNGQIDHSGICEEVDTFIFGGFDTTSMALIFAIMNLSLYPEIQEKCYQEIVAQVDDDLNTLDIPQINNLKYLDCFIKESLRLYPSATSVGRKTVQEIRLGNNLILPAGTEIRVFMYDIMRDPKYFPNPDRFDPERFRVENSSNRHPFAYAPFSAGKRNCIGQKYAVLEMKTLIIYLLKHFKLLSAVNPEDIAFKSGIILRANCDIKIKLVRRS